MKLVTMLGRAQFHGANRLADPKHRVYWAIALFLLLWLALCVLTEMILRFIEAPTHLITTDTVSDRTPFPSVLVCPEVMFPEENVEKLLASAKYPKDMDASSIRPIIMQLAAFFSPDVPYNFLDLSQVVQFLDYNGLDVEQAGLQLMASCEETIIRCRYQWVNMNCHEIFHMEIVPYGICCVFNSRSLKGELQLKISPRKDYNGLMTSHVGPQFPLMLVINQSQKLDNVDLTYKWLVVQSYRRFVDTAKNGTPLSPGSEQWAGFYTRRLSVTEDLNFLNDKLRGCRIDIRKPLRYFPVYNKYHPKYRLVGVEKRNCLVECQMRKILQQCGCLLPMHYRPFGIPICDAMSLPCARNALNVVFIEDYCDCPITCEYEYEYIDNSNYRTSVDVQPYDSLYDGLNLSKVTVLRVFVKSHQSKSNVRRTYFSFYDLFSQLGGVFNVFFGCSILTLLELFQLARRGLRLTEIRCLATTTARTTSKNRQFLRHHRVKEGRVKKGRRMKLRFCNLRNIFPRVTLPNLVTK